MNFYSQGVKELHSGSLENAFDFFYKSVLKEEKQIHFSFVYLVIISKKLKLQDITRLENALDKFLHSRSFSDRPIKFFSSAINIARKTIMKSKIKDKEILKTLPAFDARSRTKRAEKVPKFMILTCLWRRPELTSIFLEYYSNLRQTLSGRVKLDLMAVGSEGFFTKELVESHNFNYVEYSNDCLTDKWQHGLTALSSLEFDALIIIGSDDFVSPHIFDFYLECYKNGVLLSGFSDLLMFDVESNQIAYWEGYGSALHNASQPSRFGESVGLGRYVDRLILDKLNFDIWTGVKRNKGLDKAMQKKIENSLGLLSVNQAYCRGSNDLIQGYQIGFQVTKLPSCAVDVKFSDNVTSFLEFNKSVIGVEKRELLEFTEKDGILPDYFKKICRLKEHSLKSVFAEKISELRSNFSAKDSRIVVGIPTFNRHSKLNELLSDIDRESSGYKVTVGIFDDGSETPFSAKKGYKNIDNIMIFRTENYGKRKYWKRVNEIFSFMRTIDSDYYFYLPDDVRICNFFFGKSIAAWESISDDEKISLNVLEDGRTKCWTNFEREVVGSDLPLYKAQWLDMALIFTNKLLKYEVKEVPETLWENNPLASSGVGAQLSSRFHEAGFGMYQTPISLIYHGVHSSVMNPEERLLNPLSSEDDYIAKIHRVKRKLEVEGREPIVCGVASISSRLQSLAETLKSIVDQVDVVVVYQNDYKLTDGIFSSDKIIVISALDTADNMGDAGKFYTIDNWDENSIYFSIDDDLSYPSNYVIKTIAKLHKYRGDVVTYHGRTMERSCSDYYKDIADNYRCLDEVVGDHDVQFGGTGVMAFYKKSVSFSYHDLKHPNMADIWVARICAIQGVRIKVLEHDKSWIKHNKIDLTQTIFKRHRNEHSIQNSVMMDTLRILKAKRTL